MLWLLLAGFSAMFLAQAAPFPFLLERFAPSRSLWRMPQSGGPPTVYLTFDDGPNPSATPAILDALHETGASATFFVIDAHVTEATAFLLRRMFEEGHAVALHSDTRALMLKPPADLAAYLTGNADRIERLAGRRPCPLVRRASAGDIIVMHDGHHVNPEADRLYAVEATRLLVPGLKARGYQFGLLCTPSP